MSQLHKDIVKVQTRRFITNREEEEEKKKEYDDDDDSNNINEMNK